MKILFIHFCYRCENHYRCHINHICDKKRPKNSTLFLDSKKCYEYCFGHKNEMFEVNWELELGYYFTHYQIIQGKLSVTGITLSVSNYRIEKIWRNALLYSLSKKNRFIYRICEFTEHKKKMHLLKENLPLPVDLYCLVLDYSGRYIAQTYQIPDQAHFLRHDQWVLLCNYYYSQGNTIEFTIFNYVNKKTFKHVCNYSIFSSVHYLYSLCSLRILISNETIFTKEYFFVWTKYEKSISLVALPVIYHKVDSKWTFYPREEIKIALPNRTCRWFEIGYCYENKPFFQVDIGEESYIGKLERDVNTQKLKLTLISKLDDAKDQRHTLLRLYNNSEN